MPDRGAQLGVTSAGVAERQSATEAVWAIALPGENFPRVVFRADGSIEFGSGSAVPDTILARSGVNQFAAPVRGVELGYAEVLANFGLTTNVFADVTGLTTAVTVNARPLMVRAWCALATNNAAGQDVSLQILEDGATVSLCTMTASTAAKGVPISVEARRAPTPGAHTYKVQGKLSAAGVGTLFAAATFPMFLSVVEV